MEYVLFHIQRKSTEKLTSDLSKLSCFMKLVSGTDSASRTFSANELIPCWPMGSNRSGVGNSNCETLEEFGNYK